MKACTAIVSADRMTASVQGNVDERISVREAASLVRDALATAGVEHGIVDELVDLVAQRLVKDRQLGLTAVAMGTAPQPALSAGCTFSAPVYQERDLPAQVLAHAEHGIPYYQLLQHVPSPCVVKVNGVVGAIVPATPAQPGRNVFGEAVLPSHGAVQNRVDHLGKGLARTGNGTDVTVTDQGILVQRDSHCRVLPVNTNGAFSIEVARDRLCAVAHVHAAGPGGRNPRLDEIVAAARAQRLRLDDDLSALETALQELPAGTGESRRDLRIATGKAPDKGKDGWVEHVADLSFSTAPRVGDDGRADYYSLHLFENVVKGKNIARIHPPERGDPGMDVFGVVLEGVAGRPVQVRLGKNVEQSRTDPHVICATRDGHAYVRGDRIEVEEVLRVRSDVDFHTGNISFVGDVVIEGDVKAGFEVRAGGSVLVSGAVEDAIVESRKNVVLRAGFVGQGKGVIRAGNDVIVAFVRNQTITARNNVMVAGEAIDARIIAGNSVLMEATKSLIVGGDVTATRGVRVLTLGNPAGGLTRVRVGVDTVAEHRLARITQEEAKATEEMEAVSRSLGGLNASAALTREQSMTRAKMTLAVQDLQRRLARFAEERQKLLKELYVPSSQVRVQGTVYPGVTVAVAQHVFVVRDELQRCRFHVVEDAVHCDSL